MNTVVKGGTGVAANPALALLRPDLAGFAGYASARRTQLAGNVWLNANESPVPSPVDGTRSLHRYPDPQPSPLRERMADLYGVRPEQLTITRGSDEGIDLLVRAFCRARIDAICIASPCFGMYAVCARVQDAAVVDVPLRERDGEWSLDVQAVVDAVAGQGVRIVFLCSPANPTGQALSLEQVRALAGQLAGKAMLVIDEAYVEFSAIESAVTLLEDFPGLVVLRTLSKAHALAGARIGAVLADPAVIAVLRNISAPYPVPAPCAALALDALAPDVRNTSARQCQETTELRKALVTELVNLDDVTCVYPSEANFLLVRFNDPESSFNRLLAQGVVVRDVRAMPQLQDALRISIGSPVENARLLQALRGGVAA